MRLLSLRSYVLLLCPGLVPVLSVVAANPVGIPHLERLLAISLGSWLLGLAICSVLFGRGRPERTVVNSTFFALVLFWFGGILIRSFGYLVALGLIVVILGLVIAVVSRLGASWIVDVMVYGTCAVIFTGPLTSGFETIINYGTSSVEESTKLAVAMDVTPDIFLVVLDEYPGLRAIDLDSSPGEADALRIRLQGQGFQVPDSAWTSYWATDWAVPSLLNMGHPTQVADNVDATISDLYRMVSGENRLLYLLESNRYETYMIESGWSGSSCGVSYDRCITSPWLDEAMYLMLVNSGIGGLLFDQLGYAFNVGAKATMSWLEDNAAAIAQDEQPSFVFAHLMVPHPPFFVDKDCETVVDPTRFGLTFRHSPVPEEVRDSHLRGAMSCVDGFVSDLAAALGPDAVIVVVSDHGTDRREQLTTEPDSWNYEAQIERMNVILAVAADGCSVGETVVLANIMRRVISCYTSEPIPDTESRMFVGPNMQLTDDEMARVTGD